MKKLFSLFILAGLLLVGCNTPPPGFKNADEPAAAETTAPEANSSATDLSNKDNLDAAMEGLNTLEDLGIE